MGVKAGKAFMTLRIALTGSEQTPPLYDIVRVLGLVWFAELTYWSSGLSQGASMGENLGLAARLLFP